MALQPCKILSILSPNQFMIQTQQQKIAIVGDGIPNFLTKDNLIVKQKSLQRFLEQLSYVNKDALYLSKSNQIQLNGIDLIQNIEDSEEIQLNLVGVKNQAPKESSVVNEFIREKRSKTLKAILVSFEQNSLNFLYQNDTIISVVPNAITIDDFGIKDQEYTKLIQTEWLNKEFNITFKGTSIMSVLQNENVINIPVLRAELHFTNQPNIELSNEFYSSLVQKGFASISDWGKLNLSQNSFQLLYQCQEEAKRQNLGMWKAGELDRGMLNSVTSQLQGQVVEIIEANQFYIKTNTEKLNIKLDRIFIEGQEAKEFTRKLLIGKQVYVLQVGDNTPLYSIQLIENNLDIEEELISNGWATPKESYPGLSKFKYQQFIQINQIAKQKKLGQYSQELTWRVEDQTDSKSGKCVNEIIWSNIQRDKQSAKQSGVSTGISIKEDYLLEVLIDKIHLNGSLQMTIIKYHSMVNFQINGITNLHEFETSFPSIAKYQEQRYNYTYNLLMQRNVWVYFEHFNIQENHFYGRIYLKKNNKDSDFTINLLSEGLTFIKSNTDYYDRYEEAQKQAEEDKKGFWVESYAQFILDFIHNKQSLKKQVNAIENIQEHDNQLIEQVIVTVVNDSNEFYIRRQNNPEFEELEIQIENAELIPLKKPVKKGTLCLARFSEDNRVYRAQVIQAFKNDRFLVKFIDYGNNDEVGYQEMGALPSQFTSIPQQTRMCSLAYLRFPPQTHEFSEEAADILRELILEQSFDCKVKYTEKSANRHFVTLQHQGQLDELQFTINKIALDRGLGRIDHRQPYNPLKQFQNCELDAKANGIGIWGFDDCLEDEKQFEDEYDFYQ
ncbi:unnamed protein product (macronuclear) [Paramecium tetraurelia]|uniref:Tudor domain-containing protein n=1 Tax=Paramecium tetraurelia TaxID=5888 RepID=A0CK35_PARTE|nr:uncharacterized protein GSPATT00000864001 [Paramecium tetraurelia]CAK71152.1 unnamed protein product [Paramecium tetraurelia]|eukprot:XP_001438549.1 hypothetical protein (macronuclear) [Paramecium tetraurelia strain d4-2]